MLVWTKRHEDKYVFIFGAYNARINACSHHWCSEGGERWRKCEWMCRMKAEPEALRRMASVVEKRSW